MNKNIFRKGDVLEYLEYSIIDNTATQEEEEFYQDYKWFNRFDKTSTTYKKIVRKMRSEYGY